MVDRTFRVPKDDYLNDWKEEDWRFLPDTPHNLLKTGNYPFVKYMTGFSRQSAADLLFANKTIAPNYVVSREWFDEQINLWVKKYNYTLNPEGVFSAIKYAYTYWPDPKNTTHLREEYIDVSLNNNIHIAYVEVILINLCIFPTVPLGRPLSSSY